MVETIEATFDGLELGSDRLYLHGLLPALQRLDRLLEQASAAAEHAYGPKAAVDPYRGLHIDQDELVRLLARDPGAPALQPDSETPSKSPPDLIPDGSRLACLSHFFDLSSFDVDLILIALAPELDRRYERLYAYLQDHVSRRRPSVDLALNLLCPDAAARLERRVHFDPDAPLIRHGLIHLIPEPDQDRPSLLAHSLKLDEQITRFVLHQDGLDARMASYCRLVTPTAFLDELPLAPETREGLSALVSQAWKEERPLRLYFHGPVGVGKRQVAAALAAEIGLPLLVVDLAQALATNVGFAQALRLVFRYASLYSVIPCLDGLDLLRRDAHAIPYQGLLEALAGHNGITMLAGTQPWVPAARHPLGLIAVSLATPGFAGRRECWRALLDTADVSLDEMDLDALADRFRLTPAQIGEAVTTACSQAPLRLAGDNGGAAVPTVNDLFSAARAQSGHDLARLARKIEPTYTWDDIVLPDDTLAQLREICQRVAHRNRVLGEWGFDRKLSLGKGVTALFAGPSGTGKTMAAEIIAGELALDLYKIDLSGVVSKYIGETEKNLDRVFTAAENANAILFFDEADALFGKRSEVRDSHDRYANIEISYLLQKMEEYDGIAILATNLRQNLDQSFIRRLAFTVHFPFPNEDSRRRIWDGIWPRQTPLAGAPSAGSGQAPSAGSGQAPSAGSGQAPSTSSGDVLSSSKGQAVDLDFLARQFKLSGGNIKNIALAGAFLAAADGGAVTMAHLLQATRREYQKMGKVLSEDELRGA